MGLGTALVGIYKRYICIKLVTQHRVYRLDTFMILIAWFLALCHFVLAILLAITIGLLDCIKLSGSIITGNFPFVSLAIFKLVPNNGSY